MGVAVKLTMFEGPLDLLLHLIRKNEVDIYDIPVALVTHQYLEYLELMRELNIGVAGEFLVMASTLTHLKSRMLLPSRGSGDDEDETADPRDELVAQLTEHIRLKEAARRLDTMPRLGWDVFAREGGGAELAETLAQDPGEEVIEAGMFELIEAFRRLMRRRGGELTLAIPGRGISLEARMTQLLDQVKQAGSLAFEECFGREVTRGGLVVTFLAMLELCRLGLIKIFQARPEHPAPADRDWGTLRIFYRPEVASGEETAES